MDDATTHTSTEERAGANPGPAPGADWVAELPEEDREALRAKGWDKTPDPRVIWQAYRGAEKLIGQDKIGLPPERPDGSRDWEAWDGWGALGVPETPDAYDLETEREPSPADEFYRQGIRGYLHRAKLLPWQAEIIKRGHEETIGRLQDQLAEQDQVQQRETERELRELWGPDTERYRDLAMDFWRAALGDDFDAAQALTLEDGRLLFDHPLFTVAAARVAPQVTGEQGPLAGVGQAARGMRTEEAVRDEIAQLDREHGAALTNPNHAEHKSLLARRKALFAEMGDIHRRRERLG